MIYYKKFIPLILFFLIVGVFSPVLFFGKIFLDGDAVNHFYAFSHFYSSHPGSLWNQYVFSGFPAAGSFQFGFFNPLYRIAHSLFNFINALHLLLVFYYSVSALLMYAFLRSLDIRRSGAVLGAVAYALGQTNFVWASNLPVSSSFILLPALLLGLRKAFNGQTKYLFLPTIALWLSWLGAHYQWIILSLIMSGIYGLFLTWQSYKQKRKIWPSFSPFLKFLLFLLSGSILAFPQLLYTWKLTLLSTRMGELWQKSAAFDYTALPLDFVRYLLPAFNLRYLTSGEFFAYIGLFPLLFGITAIVKRARANKEVMFFTGLLIFAVLTTMKYLPFAWIISKLPILSYFRVPARWMFVGNLSLAVLAGFGFDYALQNSLYWKEKVEIYLRKFLVIFFSLIAVGNVIYFSFGKAILSAIQRWFDVYRYSKTTLLPLDYYHKAIAAIFRRSFDNINFLNAGFLIPVLFMVASYFTVRYGMKNKRFFIYLVLGLSFLSLAASGYARFSFADSKIITQPPELARIIRSREKDNHSFRIFSFLVGFASSQKITMTNDNVTQDSFCFALDGLSVNSNLYWDMPSIDGYEAMAARRGQQILSFVGSETTQVKDNALAIMQMPLEDKLKLFTSRLPLLSMLNVKYLISPYQLPSAPGLDLIHTVYSTRFKVPIYLYENKNVMPRVYLARNVSFIDSSDELSKFKIVTNSDNDFTKITFLECSDCQSKANFPSKNDKISVKTYQDGLLVLNTDIGKGRWLVFSESNLPGWQATIDGNPTGIVTANYIFQSIYIPAGDHEIRMEYVGIKNYLNHENLYFNQ